MHLLIYALDTILAYFTKEVEFNGGLAKLGLTPLVK